MARLVSVNVGLPQNIEWRGETILTAIWKQSVPDRRMVRRLNIDGDGQGDLAGHGGENRAVMVYQLESYRYWERELNRSDFIFGQFGENLTVDGLPDSEVCIGDRYRIGGALFEVTQPRVTCYRVGIRMNEPRMPALLVSHHRPGFYFRVLEEGEVGAGDEIVKVADGPGRMTVAEIDALLYLPGRGRDRLLAALRIPALSPGWQGSFRDLLNGPTSAHSPAWPGFRSLRVAAVQRESTRVVSVSLASMDGTPLPAALPGQFLVLKLRVHPEQPPLLRSYSLSGIPGAREYRVSVKHALNGAASSFVHASLKVGDMVEAGAPAGGFTLQSGDGPVVLLSAGIGATPVLAMLHALADTGSPREVWWLYGTRDGRTHPFAAESRHALDRLPRSSCHIVYSKPGPTDRLGIDYDSSGHLDIALLDLLGVPQNADFYLCGPRAFLESFETGLTRRGANSGRIHREIFGPGDAFKPGIVDSPRRAPHLPTGPASGAPPAKGPDISFVRSGLTVQWNPSYASLLELAEACDVPVKWSCRIGVCHTCESGLLAGEVEYAPDPLEPPPIGKLLLCCAQPRAASDLEIDV